MQQSGNIILKLSLLTPLSTLPIKTYSDAEPSSSFSQRVANSSNRRLETKNSSNALICMLAAEGKKAVRLEQCLLPLFVSRAAVIKEVTQ